MTQIAMYLDRSRFQPHVGCFRAEGIRGDELRRAGVPVVRFRVRSFCSPSSIGGAIQLGRYLEQHRIQLVHTFDVPLNLFGVPVARAFRTPVVVSSLRAHRDLTRTLTRHLLRITDTIADAIVVNCQAVRRHLIEVEGVPPGRIHLCYNGVDTDSFKPLVTQRPSLLRGANVVVGVVAALRPEKGLHLLLEAFQAVRAACEGVKLSIVGHGACLAELEAKSRELGIAGDCFFEGATERVAERLHAIDVFVMPSLSEALSNSLMEAMACGCAVVASRTGGNPELVEHRRTGLLFERGDSGSLAAALSELVAKPALRAQLGAAAASFIRDNFSIASTVQRMADVYSYLLSERKTLP